MRTAKLVFSIIVAGLLLSSSPAWADVIPPQIVACCSTLDAYIFGCQDAGSACRFLDGDSGICQPSTCQTEVGLNPACDGGSAGVCYAQVPCTMCMPTFAEPDAGVGDDAPVGDAPAATLDAGGGAGDVGSKPSPARDARLASGSGSGCSTTGDGGLRAFLPWLVAGAVPLLVRRRGRRGGP
jgi:uncharacterized protein (TIGR03382 family)